MRKTIVGNPSSSPQPGAEWLDLGKLASVEVSSEDRHFPAEAAFSGEGSGWRASGPGAQQVRLVFDQPRPVRRIELRFEETLVQRTQEFALRWLGSHGDSGEIVRQQWTFSPGGSTSELEDYRVELESVQAIELSLRPDLNADAPAVASLASWRVA